MILTHDFCGGISSCFSFSTLGVWLSLGGFHERGYDWETDQRIYNSHIIVNDKGIGVSQLPEASHMYLNSMILRLSQVSRGQHTLMQYSHSHYFHRRHCFSLQKVPLVWRGASRKRCIPQRKCLHHPWTLNRVTSTNPDRKGVSLWDDACEFFLLGDT